MSILAELEASLQALLALKPPGVTKSRINAITTLCVENVKSESVLVQKIYTHFKRTAGTHKLGVLYVIDSVTRQWIDKAGSSSGQELTASATTDGTYAAGVQKFSNLLPLMMNDTISSAPYDQKDKISKLVDIWERGNTFPPAMIADFKEKLDQRKPDPVEPAFPVEHTSPQSNDAQPSIPQTSIVPPTQQPTALQPTHLNGSADNSAQIKSPQNPVSAAAAAAAAAAAVTAAPPPQSLANLLPQQAQANITSDQMASLQSVIPPNIANDPAALQRHLGLLQQLVQMGVPKEHWLTVADLMEKNGSAAAAQPQVKTSRERSRSASPGPRHGSERRESTGYRDRKNPEIKNKSFLEQDKISLEEPPEESKGPKWVEFDPNLPAGSIKVLSRTLFVGGTTLQDEELRDIFKAFGQVQTCIPNPEKRHAFIKYCYREGAIRAKNEMATIPDHWKEKVRSVRWGVGFGPRDCNDYTTGISIIPIHRLTEADRKWVLTAPYGGTGGQEIKTGQVMEEPDIEIGAGVSSKAISRRLGDHETSRRHRSGGPTDFKGSRRHERDPQPPPQHYPPQAAYGNPAMLPPRYDPSIHPAVPGFGFSYQPGASGMPPY